MVVGRWNGRLVALDAGQPLLVVGPPRAGKTTAINVPNVARWRGNVVATSIRADVLDVTYARRAGRGEVRVFDPTDTLGYGLPGHLDFVTPCRDLDVARTTARADAIHAHRPPA
ncbi:MAG: type IV secretory system conjugative DNA transfer family protein [Acidimicrobiia bacterium]|nr:type IV secretory system conjugative DNA transfer family protein [Acidimicrobiia bacterium]